MTTSGRRWGEDFALLDESQARRRLIEAASRCIVRRGDAHVRMVEVADEAGVARSTLYRYFATREDLILGLLLSRIDAALAAVVTKLPHPENAAESLPDLVLEPAALIEGNPLNEALFSPESTPFVTWLELASEELVDAPLRHYGTLFEQWKVDGQLVADLDLRETMRWLNAVTLILLAPPWRHRSKSDKRRWLERYVLPGLLT